MYIYSLVIHIVYQILFLLVIREKCASREGHTKTYLQNVCIFSIIFEEIFQDSARIEAAFRKYIHRADPGQKKDSIEVFVCHANVIRYFVCRYRF